MKQCDASIKSFWEWIPFQKVSFCYWKPGLQLRTDRRTVWVTYSQFPKVGKAAKSVRGQVRRIRFVEDVVRQVSGRMKGRESTTNLQQCVGISEMHQLWTSQTSASFSKQVPCQPISYQLTHSTLKRKSKWDTWSFTSTMNAIKWDCHFLLQICWAH